VNQEHFRLEKDVGAFTFLDHNLPVPSLIGQERQNCGWNSISKDDCHNKGCCDKGMPTPLFQLGSCFYSKSTHDLDFFGYEMTTEHHFMILLSALDEYLYHRGTDGSDAGLLLGLPNFQQMI
jgi:hypothetical protein